MENDVLYNCASAYQKLADYKYDFIFTNTNKISIEFENNAFLHLTSIEKLDDLVELEGTSSSTVLNMILQKKLTYDRLKESKHFNDLKYGFSDQNKYGVKDRLMALTNLFDLLHNISAENVWVYKWQSEQYQRPNNSKINADYLIEFDSVYSPKTENEKVYFFVLNERSSKKSVGVSIFPTDISYSDDGKIKLTKCEILSADEIYLPTGKITHLIECDEKTLQQAYDECEKKKQLKIIYDDLKDLKKKREKVKNAPDNKALADKYENKMGVFRKANIYTPEMLNEVIERLSAQMNDIHNSDVAPYIKREIDFLASELERRRASEKFESAVGGFTITLNQLNNDGTFSAVPAAEVPIPKVIDEIHGKAEREAHKAMGGIRSLFYDIKDALKNLLAKKSERSQEETEREAPEDIYTEPYSLDFPSPPKHQYGQEQESEGKFPQKEIAANKHKHSLEELKTYARQVRMEREREPRKEKEEKNRNDYSDISR